MNANSNGLLQELPGGELLAIGTDEAANTAEYVTEEPGD
jgi:hypothetical protein